MVHVRDKKGRGITHPWLTPVCLIHILTVHLQFMQTLTYPLPVQIKSPSFASPSVCPITHLFVFWFVQYVNSDTYFLPLSSLTVIFVSGRKYYKEVPPTGNLFGSVVRCVGVGLCNLSLCSKKILCKKSLSLDIHQCIGVYTMLRFLSCDLWEKNGILMERYSCAVQRGKAC